MVAWVRWQILGECNFCRGYLLFTFECQANFCKFNIYFLLWILKMFVLEAIGEN